MSGGDLLGALPDDVLQHVLSYLSSRDAVQSAVLSRRWRHLWRSTPAVSIKGSGEGFRLFVNSLLLHRDSASPLRSFEIDAYLLKRRDEDEEEYGYRYYDFHPREVDPHIDEWIRHAVSTCRARSLTARFENDYTMWTPRKRRPFASLHLTTVHLHGVELAGDLLDFSCCPALLHLSLTGCRLRGDAIVSPSLDHLRIIDCDIPICRRNIDGRTPTRICVPSLRFLQLSDNYDGVTAPPFLETMPSLTNASIQLTGNTRIHDDGDDDGSADDHRSLLLNGLSQATILELIASTTDGRIILRRDLKWCPTFTKLKTLILNEWCVYDDVIALVCLLRHTPRLESLILQLPLKNYPKLEVETQGSHITPEQTILTFEHLKTVEIKSSSYKRFARAIYFDTRVDEILKLFRDWGIPNRKISINQATS